MSMGQRAQNLLYIVYRFFPGQNADTVNVVLESYTVYKLHDDILSFVGNNYVENLDNILMIEHGYGF